MKTKRIKQTRYFIIYKVDELINHIKDTYAHNSWQAMNPIGNAIIKFKGNTCYLYAEKDGDNIIKSKNPLPSLGPEYNRKDWNERQLLTFYILSTIYEMEEISEEDLFVLCL